MSYDTAYSRWSGVGPYYAMFPINFVDRVIDIYTKPGDWIFDPFAGRASSVFSGASRGRPSIGIEINPVGWLYGQTKISVACMENVKSRLAEITQIAKTLPTETGDDLHEFFRHCFSKNVLHFLIAARDNLNWIQSQTDRTLMALILVDLHGGRDRSFSNQMRQSRAMSPDYSIQWWKERSLTPPSVDPQMFLEKKFKWRYAKGLPEVVESTVLLGDSSVLISRIKDYPTLLKHKGFKLLFTSPPYIGISDYHRDQWLRLWMLGNEPACTRSREKYRGAFSSPDDYKNLLLDVFSKASELMNQNGYVYVRTDARPLTFEITREVLHLCFPKWQEEIIKQPYKRETQTALYGDKSKKPGEIDIILSGPSQVN